MGMKSAVLLYVGMGMTHTVLERLWGQRFAVIQWEPALVII